MSLIVLAAIWLVGLPVVVLGAATLKAELERRRGARELDRWLTQVLSGGRSRSRLARLRRHKKASRAAVTAGTLTQRRSTSYERL